MTCVDRIIDFQRCEQLSSKEIAFQFIKQTRKNPELFWTRNVWKLFGVLMEKMGEIDFGEVRFFCFGFKIWIRFPNGF